MTSNTLAEFLVEEGRKSVAVHPDTEGVPALAFPVPAGWNRFTGMPSDVVYAVWAAAPVPGTQWADNALLSLGRLDGPVDARGALTRALNETAALPNWSEESVSYADYQRFPSGVVVGTYDFGEYPLWAATRYVFADVADVQYLIQFTVTALRGGEPIAADVLDVVNQLTIEIPGAAG